MESLTQRPHCWLILLNHWATWDSPPCAPQSLVKASELRDVQPVLISSSHSSGRVQWEQMKRLQNSFQGLTVAHFNLLRHMFKCMHVMYNDELHQWNHYRETSSCPWMSWSNLQYHCNLKRLNWVWYSIFVNIFRSDSRSVCVNLITAVEAGSLVMLLAAII